MSDVTKKDWDWLLNTCTYGQLFTEASEVEMDSLRTLGNRWKQYEKEGKWKYEAHPFWCTGYTFVCVFSRYWKCSGTTSGESTCLRSS